MLFMVIERFRDQDGAAVYRCFREKGRMLPDGLKYADSWVEVNGNRCFQVMACDDLQLFQQWFARWDDLVDFEIVAVRTSKAEGSKEIKEGNSRADFSQVLGRLTQACRHSLPLTRWTAPRRHRHAAPPRWWPRPVGCTRKPPSPLLPRGSQTA